MNTSEYIGQIWLPGEIYRLTKDQKPLAMFPVHTNSWNWSTEQGLRQVALDLMIDFFDEKPLLGTDVKSLAAYWPSQFYVGPLNMIHLPVASRWVITKAQITSWFDDWSIRTHRHFAEQQHAIFLKAPSFEAWLILLGDMCAECGHTVASLNITAGDRMRYYLSGYSAEDVAIACVNAAA